MVALSERFGDVVHGNRIMVIGQNVAVVQRVSRYCLEKGADVFPYYGTPTVEEITLFSPQVSVLCFPVPQDVLNQIDHPYILWSDERMDPEQSSVCTWQDLETRLRNVLQPLN